MNKNGPIWDEQRLRHTAAVRKDIMACIQRLNTREHLAISRAVMKQGGTALPRPNLRAQIREWYRERWTYLLSEYEAILPHVNELPPAYVEQAVKHALMEADNECENLPPR